MEREAPFFVYIYKGEDYRLKVVVSFRQKRAYRSELFIFDSREQNNHVDNRKSYHKTLSIPL